MTGDDRPQSRQARRRTKPRTTSRPRGSKGKDQRGGESPDDAPWRGADMKEEPEESEESSLSICLQVLLPYLLAGTGMVLAGAVLDSVRRREVFQAVPELLIVAPALVGLKGNLEMTLAARLSTAANTFRLDDPGQRRAAVCGNLALVQVQATVAGLLAAAVALCLGAATRGGPGGLLLDPARAAVLCGSTIVTACTAALSLAVVTITVVLASRWLGVNPDNVATPVAASLGDLVALSLLAAVADALYRHHLDGTWWCMSACATLFLALIPAWAALRTRPEFGELLHTGWRPLVAATCVSSLAGLLLDQTVRSDPRKFVGIAMLAPVINGAGGNLAAVQASRISTRLHASRSVSGDLRSWASPWDTFFSPGSVDSRSARALLALVAPGHLAFLYAASLLHGGGDLGFSATFVVLYLCAAMMQAAVLLWAADLAARRAWRRGLDPDDHCIPYLTALGDVLGTGLLALCFHWAPMLQGMLASPESLVSNVEGLLASPENLSDVVEAFAPPIGLCVNCTQPVDS